MMVQRRQMLKTLVAASLFPAIARAEPRIRRTMSLRSASNTVDWLAVRELFPLAPDWTHLSSFLFVSHPKPVAEAIDHFRRKLDGDAFWIETAAFTDAEGGRMRPSSGRWPTTSAAAHPKSPSRRTPPRRWRWPIRACASGETRRS